MDKMSNTAHEYHVMGGIHDVEDYVVFYISNNDTGEHSHKTKSRVRYTVKGAPYFMHKGHRIYLDECMRVKI